MSLQKTTPVSSTASDARVPRMEQAAYLVRGKDGRGGEKVRTAHRMTSVDVLDKGCIFCTALHCTALHCTYQRLI